MPEATDEWDNLVASAEQAAARGELGSAFELIWTTRRFAIYRGGFDVVSWAAPMTQRPDAMAAPAFAEAAALVAVGLTRRGEYGAAEVLVDRALLAPTERPDEVGFRASMVRGFIESGDRQDVPASLPHYRNTLSFALSPADEAIQCANLSSLLSDIEPAEASVHASRATDLLEHHDVPSSQRALVLALLALGAADPEEVRRFADEAVELADRVGATWSGGLARGELFRVAVLHDTPIDAFAMLREMLADLHERGQLMDSSTVVWTAARLLTQLGIDREALLLDDALGAVGVRTLAVHAPALDALSPTRSGSTTTSARGSAARRTNSSRASPGRCDHSRSGSCRSSRSRRSDRGDAFRFRIRRTPALAPARPPGSS